MKKQIAAFLALLLLTAGVPLSVAAAEIPAVRASDDLNYSTTARDGYIHTAALCCQLICSFYDPHKLPTIQNYCCKNHTSCVTIR